MRTYEPTTRSSEPDHDPAPDTRAGALGTGHDERPRARGITPRSAGALTLLVVGLVAAVVRLRLLASPTPFYYGTYDDGVYFTEALRLVHGLLPYRDGVFLQPPGLVLATAPFAALASFIGDSHAFVIARGGFALLGAVNAVLVAANLRRSGLLTAAVGGLIYALAWPAVYLERTIALEVPGTTAILISLLLLRVSDSGRRLAVLAGAAAGIAVDLKIWYVPLLIVLAVLARRRAGWFLAGGAVAGLAVYLPFFIAAPAVMWRQIVVAQLGRPNQDLPVWIRIRSIIGVDAAGTGRPWWQLSGTAGAVLLLALLAIVVVLALTTPDGRAFVALLAVSAAILLISPSYLQHYATLTAAPLALVGAAGVGRLAALMRNRWTTIPLAVLAVLVAVVAYLPQDLGIRTKEDRPIAQVLPIARLKTAAATVHGCLISDDPTVLVLMNRLSADLDRGCDVQADPSGIGFVLTTPGVPQVYRPQNPLFQKEIVSYLHSADAYIQSRSTVGLGLSTATQQLLDQDRVLARVHRFTIRAGRPAR